MCAYWHKIEDLHVPRFCLHYVQPYDNSDNDLNMKNLAKAESVGVIIKDYERL